MIEYGLKQFILELGNDEFIKEFEELQAKAKPETCSIEGCVNNDTSFDNNCNYYNWVQCCVDCTPFSKRFRNEIEGER